MPVENTPNGNSVAPFDKVPDPEDDGTMVHALARFMRSTKAPPRDEVLAATPQGASVSALFDLIGCPICHIRDIHTALSGSGTVEKQPKSPNASWPERVLISGVS